MQSSPTEVKTLKKLKYNVCTLDFSTPTYKRRKIGQRSLTGLFLLFCWDTDSYRLLKPENVTSVVPLSSVLKNEN